MISSEDVEEARRHLVEGSEELRKQQQRASEYTRALSHLRLSEKQLLLPGLVALSKLADDIIRSNDQNDQEALPSFASVAVLAPVQPTAKSYSDSMAEHLDKAKSLFEQALQEVNNSNDESNRILEQIHEDTSTLQSLEDRFSGSTENIERKLKNVKEQLAGVERMYDQSARDFKEWSEKYDRYTEEYKTKAAKVAHTRSTLDFVEPWLVVINGPAGLLESFALEQTVVRAVQADRDAAWDKKDSARRTMVYQEKELHRLQGEVAKHMQERVNCLRILEEIKATTSKVKSQEDGCRNAQDRIGDIRRELLHIHEDVSRVSNAASILSLRTGSAKKVLRVLTRVPINKDAELESQVTAIFRKLDIMLPRDVKKQVEYDLSRVRRMLKSITDHRSRL